MIPLSDTTRPIPGAQPTPPCGRGSTNGDGPVGWVVLMGQILVDLAVRGEALPSPGDGVWAIDEGMHVGGGFNALVAARRMGVEAVSLSLIGDGPYSSLVQTTLTYEGITDLGPRATGIDNGFCIAFTGRTGERTFISAKGAETMAFTSVWTDFVRTMNPGDVLHIDGYLMDYPANHEAAKAALCALPKGVHVVLDVSPAIGIPERLPSDDVIVSMNHGETQEIVHRRGHASVHNRCDQPREVTQGVLAVLGRPVLVRAGTRDTYFILPARTVLSAHNEDMVHVPTPRVKAIGTNGAGDTHSGVLAVSLTQGIPAEQVLLLANCAGALSTTVVGPASYPTCKEVEAAADALEAGNDKERTWSSHSRGRSTASQYTCVYATACDVRDVSNIQPSRLSYAPEGT